MPFGDRTGPQGYGPMTGKGGGHCTGFSRPGFGMRPRHFLGRGNRGFQPGMERGMWTNSASRHTVPPESAGFQGNELDSLKAQAKAITNQLDEIRNRIDELEK